MILTQSFEKETHSSLASEINNWLMENPDLKVIDIKYTCWGNKIGLLGPTFSAYSALILYETKSGKK